MNTVSDRVQVSCSGCRRPVMMALRLLASRRACAYCGHPLEIPPAVLAALSSTPAADAPTRSGPPILAECPLCTHGWRVKGEMAGQRTTCTICGCPFQVPDRDGLGALVPDLDRMPSVEGHELRIACPCGHPAFRTTNRLGTRAACAKCRKELDTCTIPLAELADLTVADSDSARLARALLTERWKRGDAGLGEAVVLFQRFDTLERWTSAGRPTLSPFTAETTADLLCEAILDVGTANRRKEGDVTCLDLLQPRREAAGTAQVVAAGLLFGAVGAALMAAHNANTGDGIVRIVVHPVPEGSDVRVEIQNVVGQVRPAPADKTARLREILREALPAAARRFFAFKSIFGFWTSGTMFQAAGAAGIQRRLASLKPGLSPKWAGFIAEKTRVRWTDLWES